MVHLESYVKSLKVTWLRRILLSSPKSSLITIFNETCQCELSSLLQFGPEYPKQLAKKCNNLFWKELLNAFSEFLYIVLKNSNQQDHPLWFNSNISIENNPIFINSLYKKGFFYVSDLFNKDGNFLSFEELRTNFGVTLPFTKVLGLKRAIFSFIKNAELKQKEYPHFPECIRTIIKRKKGSKDLYNVFLSNINSIYKLNTKWNALLQLGENFDWKSVFMSISNCTKDSKLLWFQYRIFYRILATNNYLYKCKITTNNTCNLCKQEVESIEHLFFYCAKSNEIWKQFEQMLLSQCNMNVNLTLTDILLGCTREKYHALNLMILLIKQYIFYKSRKSNVLSIDEIKKCVLAYYQTEKWSHGINMKQNQFTLRWRMFSNLFG